VLTPRKEYRLRLSDLISDPAATRQWDKMMHVNKPSELNSVDVLEAYSANGTRATVSLNARYPCFCAALYTIHEHGRSHALSETVSDLLGKLYGAFVDLHPNNLKAKRSKLAHASFSAAKICRAKRLTCLVAYCGAYDRL
jgi:hypothetical protein